MMPLRAPICAKCEDPLPDRPDEAIAHILNCLLELFMERFPEDSS